MVPSVLTACFFAASGICGRRAALGLGALRANAIRLALASVLLGTWVWWQQPVNFETRTVHWLLVSGVVGFGFGDVCLFLAYPRIGARLALLVSLCGAPIFGAALDWLLHGTVFTPAQAFSSAVILTGVGIALLGGHGPDFRRHLWSFGGVLAALMAGLGQGFGAALSRHAQAIAEADGTVLDGISQAFVRTLPGMCFAMVVWRMVARRQMRRPSGGEGHAWSWLLAAVMTGPVIGVSCFQWALSLQSSVVVLSITATAPVLIMPLAMVIDREHVAPLAIVGAIVAVAGVILLLNFGAL